MVDHSPRLLCQCLGSRRGGKQSPARVGGNVRTRSRLLRLAAVALTVLTFFLGLAGAYWESDSPTEYKVKAAFLYNFIKFVDWPEKSFPEADRPIRIAILGRDPFGTDIGFLEGKTVRGKRLVIERYQRVEEIAECHVLFVSSSEKRRFEEVLSAVAGWNVLTVADTEGFVELGGGIALFEAAHKIRFEVNPQAIRRAGLTVSSKLLRLARVLEEESIELKD